MSLSEYSPKHYQLKKDLITAREQLFVVLDRYAELCSAIRNTHHQTSFKDTQLAGFPWPDVGSELPFLPLLETRLQEAMQNLNRAHELGQARSSSAYSHPINKLPDEILAHIFRFAVAAPPHDLPSIIESSAKGFPHYPDSIAQTCARWRQVTLTCSPLWTCIYLAPHPTHFDSILDRAKLLVKRAGHHSLELHITDMQAEVDPDHNSNMDGLKQFIASIAPRTKSLEIVRSGLYTSGFEREGLVGILRGCSKIFTRLAMRSKGLCHPGYIRPFVENDKHWDMKVDLSPEQIERGLAHLTVLHASQISPEWGSTAYQGLVDLRLIPNHKYTRECPIIEASKFIAILKASPRLRILHFGLDLSFSHGLSTDKVNVWLKELEVLHLSASGVYSPQDTEYEIQYIMRYITPGKKPLRLTLDHVHYQARVPLEGMKAFFSKSCIVKFCARRGTPPPVELVDCAPHLTQLVFDCCRYDQTYGFYQGPSKIPSLDSWILRDSLIYAEDLRLLSIQYSAESIIMSNCRFFSKEEGPVEIPEPKLEDWGCDLPDFVQYICPDPSPDPTAGWNDLD